MLYCSWVLIKVPSRFWKDLWPLLGLRTCDRRVSLFCSSSNLYPLPPPIPFYQKDIHRIIVSLFLIIWIYVKTFLLILGRPHLCCGVSSSMPYKRFSGATLSFDIYMDVDNLGVWIGQMWGDVLLHPLGRLPLHRSSKACRRYLISLLLWTWSNHLNQAF